MSLGHLYFRVCNTCQVKAASASTAKLSVQQAQLDGWLHRGSFDFCPGCRDAIEKVMAERTLENWKARKP